MFARCMHSHEHSLERREMIASRLGTQKRVHSGLLECGSRVALVNTPCAQISRMNALWRPLRQALHAPRALALRSASSVCFLLHMPARIETHSRVA